MITDQPTQSWKTQPYVWMLIVIPFSAIIMGVVMMKLAIESDTGLVVDDYYKKGKQINQVIARDQAAATMALSAEIRFDTDSGEVLVNLSAKSEMTDSETITLGFYHATRPGMDQSRVLKRIGDGQYVAEFNPLDPGRWKVQLATGSWRLTGSLHRPGGDSLHLIAMSAD